MRYRPSMPRLIRAALVAGLLSSSMSRAAARAVPNPPDVIFHHGKIITVDGQSRVAEAVAIAGDRFYAVGSNAEIEALAGPDTRRIDLQGHAVLAGC